MALYEQTTHLRDRDTRANSSRIKKVLVTLKRWLIHRKHPHIEQLNDHLARDIGLSPNDLARHQHRWPSQHSHHPRG